MSMRYPKGGYLLLTRRGDRLMRIYVHNNGGRFNTSYEGTICELDEI